MLFNGINRSVNHKPQITDSSVSFEDAASPKKKSTHGEKQQQQQSNMNMNSNLIDYCNDSCSIQNSSGMPILKSDNNTSILNTEAISLIPKYKTKSSKKKNTSRKHHKNKEDKNTKPNPLSSSTNNIDSRFIIVHNDSPEKKKLDNSYEDYFFYEIVDEDSFNVFMKLTEEYISLRLIDKTLRLYNSLKRLISDTISTYLKQIHIYPELIHKVINKTLNKTSKKKSLCERLCACCPCFKEKEKYELDNQHNMKDKAESIDNELTAFIEDVERKYNEKGLNEVYEIKMEEVEEFAKEKAKVFFNKKGMKERMRLEVERYSKYFNIERIIEKQENTLQSQTKKMNKLNDIKELNECIICMDKQRNIIFFPCNHLICCEECGYSKVLGECPECKMTIESKTITN